ncbi:MAG: hypothetical protein R3B70_24110 [Polyangiaceae bacterium]
MTAARADRPISRARARRKTPPRDQAPSPFTPILDRLVASTPSARGAALVDFEGETVDYAGGLDPFELKVAAATWLIVLAEVGATSFSAATQIVIRAARSSYVLRRVNDDYALVLVLHARAAFAVSDRALGEAEAALANEAGWSRRNRAAWFGVHVRTETGVDHRPLSMLVGDAWQPIEVMGALVSLHDRERGYRVRLPSGAEMMLIRERNGLWFADEPVATLASHAGALP